ncbi:MAG: glycosyltransferase [Candidatus Omnitrophica bacterium]|nr:glycosyltransferase [Candidatus Omnitrophota bacterium]
MKKNIKVLFITPYYYPNLKGGSERSLKLLAEGLAKEGLDINVLSFDGKNDMKREKFFGVKVIRVKSPDWKPNTLALNLELNKYKNLIKEESPDAIHVYNTWQIPAALKLKKYAKVVATLNNYYPLIAISYTRDNLVESGNLFFYRIFTSTYKTLEGNFIKRFFLALFYTIYGKIYITPKSKKLDAYIAYVKSIKKIYEKAGFDGRKIYVIRSPFEFKKIPKINIKRKNNIVLYVGGALESKGFYDLMKAIKLIKNSEIEFRIAGVNREDPLIRKIIDSRIKFLGKLNEKELKKQYLESSVLVHPAIWPEPFSRVWMEALNYEIPIISSDNPVALDVLKGAAIFYKRKNPQELAKKITEFLSGKLRINKKDYLQAKKRIFSQDPVKEMIKFYRNLK